MPEPTVSATETGRSNAADSASATVNTPVTRERTSSVTETSAGPLSVAASLMLEARSTTEAVPMFGCPAGTGTPAVQSKAAVGTAVGAPVLAPGWFHSPPLASAPVFSNPPPRPRRRSSAMTCKVQEASRSRSKVTLSPASASFTWMRLPWICNASLTPPRSTAQSPPVSDGVAKPMRTPPPPKPVA